MKIFISQPMKGKTKEEIEADSSLVCRLPMQLEQVEFVEVPELSQTERGAKGYGSTGR